MAIINTPLAPCTGRLADTICHYDCQMRERWLLMPTAAYAAALALIGLWATPVDQNVAVAELAPVRWMAGLLDLTTPESYRLVEMSANVALFIPLGALVLLWWPRWTWWQAAAVAFASSLAIETLQAILRPDRFATFTDLAANTVGGALGGLLTLWARRLLRR